jgi:hypothetical protein
VGPVPGVRAAVPGQARSWLRRSGQALRGRRAGAWPGGPGRPGPAGGLLRWRRPGRRRRGGRTLGGPGSRPDPERRQHGQWSAARTQASGRCYLGRNAGGVARELAQRVGDLLCGAADDDAGGVVAALRRQRPGRGRGVRRAAGDGRPGAAGAPGRQAARGGSGRRSRLGPGSRMPRGTAAVRILRP